MSDMKNLLDRFLQAVLSLFPLSPFREVTEELGNLPYLGYINWFVPIGDFVKIGTVWLAAIAAYYAWSIIARWIRLIS